MQETAATRKIEPPARIADISGYTPVTEALAEELGSQRGARYKDALAKANSA